MPIRNLSIKRKLTLITMCTSSIALVLSSASFLIYDLISFRRLLSQDLITQAEIIGNNSAAAMAFRDKVAATATLWALKPGETLLRGAYTPPMAIRLPITFAPAQCFAGSDSSASAKPRLPL